VVKTALAVSVLSPREGRRAVLARALQLDLECISLFIPTRSNGLDDERFPPLSLDAHPMVLLARQPSLRSQLLDAARRRVSKAFGRLRRR
jgi:hypothetical protein